MKTNADVLLQILKSHAPDDAARKLCDDFFQGWAAETRERAIACSLVDGLKFGNWLWIKPEIVK
jgi:hypothetical protein